MDGWVDGCAYIGLNDIDGSWKDGWEEDNQINTSLFLIVTDPASKRIITFDQLNPSSL